MKKLLLVTFVFTGIALPLAEAFLYTVEPGENPFLPAWLPVTLVFLLFCVTFSLVACVSLKPHIHEAAGWIGLLLLACLGGTIGYMRLSTSGVAKVELGVFVLYAVCGLVGAGLAFRRGTRSVCDHLDCGGGFPSRRLRSFSMTGDDSGGLLSTPVESESGSKCLGVKPL